MNARSQRSRAKKVTMADAPPEVLADVDAITAVDAKVYRAAVLRLLCDIRALEEAAGARVLCPARLAKLRAATSYIPRLWGRGANASARYD